MGFEVVVRTKIFDEVLNLTDAIDLKNLLLLILFEPGRVGFEVAGV